jgi:hypothetical protein
MARLNYNVVGVGIFDSVGFEFLAIPDIRPTQLAPLGDENDLLNIDAPYAFIFSAFEPLLGVVSLHEDVAARNWENMEYGMSLLFSLRDLEMTLHYFVGHQDNGVIDWSGFPSLCFTHPRQRTYGLSFNWFFEPVNGVFRGEATLTDKMHLGYNPTGNPFAFPEISKKNVYQVVLGFDKDWHPKWIGTTSALTMNFDAYWKHIKNLEVDQDPLIYAADKKDTGIGTVMFMTDYHHGMIKPMIYLSYDTEGAWVTRGKLGWDPDGKWLFEVTAMAFMGNRTPLSQYSVDGAMQDNSELSFKVSYRF